MGISRRSFLGSVIAALLAPASRAYGMGTDPGATPNDEDVLLTYGARYVTGDVSSIGDQPFRIVDSVTGAGLFTGNSDPNAVQIDPITGEDAPLGTDVGFGSALRRFIHTGVLNGDFSVPPPRPGDPISDDNPLPYWLSTGGPILTASSVSSASAASGHVLHLDAGANTGLLIEDVYQLVPVPRSQGQQYRALLSTYATVSGLNSLALTYQFMTADLTEVSDFGFVAMNESGVEFKIDAGLVPPTASYIRVALACGLGTAASSADVHEVRCAFLPAEAVVGLGTLSSATGSFSTTETVAKGITIPAGTFTVGSTYRFTCHGLVTSNGANTITFRMRVGPASLSGNIAMSRQMTATTTASGDGFGLTGLFTVRSVGAGGTALGNVMIVGSGSQPFSVNAASSSSSGTVAVDTTVENELELTIVTSAGGTTVNVTQAAWECVLAA